MKLQNAKWIIREVHGKHYSWLREWGLSTIKEALRTIFDRASSTKEDIEIASDIQAEISLRRK